MASLTSYSSPSDSSTAGDITTMDLDFLDDLLLQANDNEDDWELAQLAIDAVINSLDNHHSSGIPMAPPLEPTAVAPALPSSSTMYALQSESFVTPQPSFQHNQQPTLTNSHAPTNDDDDDFEEDDFEVEEEPPANLSPSDLAAIRRLRHREAMQRCRQRKRSRMGSLEKQRKQMKALLKQRLLEHQHREEREARLQHGDKAPPLPQIERLRRMFARVVNLKEALLDERQGLEESLREHQKFERIVMQSTTHIVNDPTAKLGSLLGGPTANDASMDNSMEEEASSSGQDSTDGPGLPSASSSRRKGPAGHWVQYVDDEPPLFYEPESTESIDEHVRECYQRVRRLQHAFDVNLIVAKETHCLGWRAQHSLSRVDQKVELRFRFRRRVPLTRLSLEELQQASWKVMRDPVQNARLYSSLVVCKIVQYVGENTFIFLRNAPDKDKRLHIRYFSMHSQMEYSTTDNERAFMTLMKILDKDPHILEPSDDMPAKKPPTPVIWLKDGTLFMNFTEKKEDGQIEIEYGGAVHCPSEDHARYLMVEVGGVLMRWEQFVVPQQLLPF